MNKLELTISSRIQTSNPDYPLGYIGINMSKTHSQDNSLIDKHNEEIFSKFSDYLDVTYVMQHFDCWKGSCFWKENEDIRLEFGGWESNKIIGWIIKYKGLNALNKNQQNFRIITHQQRYAILKRQRWNCNCCGQKLKFKKTSSWDGEIAHIDHIYPYSKKHSYPNGEENINELENLQALCQKCNLTKSNKLIQ